MVFSDPFFIFGFLPVFLIFYAVIAGPFKNIYIFLMSLAFYYRGEPSYVWVLLLTIVVNYGLGLAIGWLGGGRTGRQPGAKAALVLGIAFNLGMLLYFKYAGFFASNINQLFASLRGGNLLPALSHALPLGISFFTFQGISYCVDVYRGDVRPTASLMKYGTYKILFPQLIAGPIVRYAEVAAEMGERTVTTQLAMEGLRRFVVGFLKKVLVADTLAGTADAIFGVDPASLSMGASWLGAVCYALQIYFDFSAYSDMAIGLGRMMGFHYPENFNHPYISRSIREFWRRWHMTLSFWFRDYVYRPLGGNRLGPVRTYVNLFIVFVLTGFWHGAAWTFICWGLWHGGFMLLERRFPTEAWPVPDAVRRIYTLLAVLFGWVLFRADTIQNAGVMMQHMLGIKTGRAIHLAAEFYNPVLGITLAAALLLSTPVHAWARAKLGESQALAVGTLLLGTLFVLACMKVLSGAYSPFLYFRF